MIARVPVERQSSPRARECFSEATDRMNVGVSGDAHDRWKQRILGASRAATAITGEVMVVQYQRVGIAFLFSLLLSAATAELHAFWSMPGLTAIVDESSAALVLFNDTGSASVRSTVSKAVVKLRFPVPEDRTSTSG